MADRYRNYADLCAHENARCGFQHLHAPGWCQGCDHRAARRQDRAGHVRIARAIGGVYYRIYCFEGTKANNNTHLHITSTNFDEPEGLELVSACDHVVALHGCADGEETIYVGGRDTALRDAIRANLDAAGFTTGIHADPNLQGTSLQNICNRGRRRQGVQLEISPDLRDAIRVPAGAQRLNSLAECVRAGIR